MKLGGCKLKTGIHISARHVKAEGHKSRVVCVCKYKGESESKVTVSISQRQDSNKGNGQYALKVSQVK
jgi:hypothetical protein